MSEAKPSRKCFHFKHGAYYYVKKNKWERLSADLATALRMYEERQQSASCPFGRLVDEAIAARHGIKASTRRQYQTAARHIKHAFAQFTASQVQPRHIAQFRQQFADAPNMGNRCLSVLRLVFAYALDRQLVDTNPVIGATRYKETKRPRLLTPEEYRDIYRHAPPRLQVVMDLCYLTGQRISDVLAIRRSQIRDGGIEFVQGKTGKRLLVRAPGLEEVIARAIALHGAVNALTLFRSRYGGPPAYQTVRDQWDRACTAAGVQDSHLHDLRAMSLTHAKAQGKNPTLLAGHTSEAMTARYLRAKEVPEAQGPALSTIRSGKS